MDTKGVASVRSPVCNLHQYNQLVGHEMFVDAVVHAFREEYGITGPVSICKLLSMPCTNVVSRSIK